MLSYLASLPPGQTAYLMAFAPGFLMLLGGFAWAHASDVRAGC